MEKWWFGICLVLFMSIGFSSTSFAEEFQLKGQILAEDVPFYDEIGKEVPIGNLKMRHSIIYYKSTDSSEWVEIQIGEKSYFTSSQFILPSEELIPAITEGTKRNIHTKPSFSIYSEPSATSIEMVKGNVEVTYETIGYENSFFIVKIAGKIGYLSVTQTQNLFSQPVQNVEVLHDKIPLYEVRTGKRVQIGSLAKGFIFTRSKEVLGYHQFEMNGKVYQVSINDTYPSSQNVVLKPPAKPLFPTKVRIKTETVVSNDMGKAIGYLSRGNFTTVYNIKDEQAVIEFLGSTAYIPLKNVTHINLVQPKKNIGHREMSYWMKMVAGMYPEFTKLEMIGKSVEGRAIYALKVGTGKKEILFDASLHAREHMTTNVLLEMIDNYTIHYYNSSKFAGYDVKQVLSQTSIWFVPMMNPDGVTLVQGGKYAVKNGSLAQKINGSTNFARWKANVRGVDLNKNFDAGWNLIKTNAQKPSYMGYRGPRVFSEPESVALKHFVEKHSFKSYISYHSSGQVLYWFNFQSGAQLSRDVQYVNQMRSITGYSVVPPYYRKGTGSSADWFIDKTKMPGITVEIAPYAGETPVPLIYWDRIWNQNHKVGLHAANEAWKRK
ncbi:MAG: M14 family zinc carboxypeptidase [Paenisporosarcina sp.]|nr:M14 family zinc carboxypeptidase [Paenisporosarcina sp.]